MMQSLTHIIHFCLEQKSSTKMRPDFEPGTAAVFIQPESADCCILYCTIQLVLSDDLTAALLSYASSNMLGMGRFEEASDGGTSQRTVSAEVRQQWPTDQK